MSKSGKSSAAGESKSEGKSAVDADLAFEPALKRLEELVRRLEQGNLPLDQSLADYSEAVELIRLCQGRLAEAQVKIEVLSGFDPDGNPIVRDLPRTTGESLEEKQLSRSNRRSAEAAKQTTSDGPAGAARTRRKTSDVDDPGQLF
ncbi:MAG: exodeoxyribonuclease VII small subunit [Pirellulales bacterium]